MIQKLLWQLKPVFSLPIFQQNFHKTISCLNAAYAVKYLFLIIKSAYSLGSYRCPFYNQTKWQICWIYHSVLAQQLTNYWLDAVTSRYLWQEMLQRLLDYTSCYTNNLEKILIYQKTPQSQRLGRFFVCFATELIKYRKPTCLLLQIYALITQLTFTRSLSRIICGLWSIWCIM